MLHRLTALLATVLLSTTSLSAAGEEIVVQLATQVQLTPVYLTRVQAHDQQLPEGYLRQLGEVFQYDLSHNGTMRLLPPNEERRGLERSSVDQKFDAAVWRSQNVTYVIEPYVSKKALGALVYATSGGQGHRVGPFPLTGNLQEDRRRVHQVHDTVHRVLMGTPGIADTRLLYSVRVKGAGDQSEIWESDYDGANSRRLVNDSHLLVTPSYIAAAPGYRPASFLYVSYQSGQPKIYAGNLKDGSNGRVSYLRGNQLMATVSPAHDKMAFVCDASGNPDLFLQEYAAEGGAVGKPRQIFTAAKSTQASPVFSPDGRRIAFASDKDGSPRIYTMTVPPAGVSNVSAQLISRRNPHNSCPSWSPDGKKIAYSALTGGVRQIWIYDLASGEERQLTSGSGHKENPCWAADSLHLVFNSQGPGGSELYMVNLNESKVTHIKVPGQGEKRFPSWEPVCYAKTDDN
jgi:TolB protein